MRVFLLTGAGISADSGLDTYRDAGGLWEGRSFEEVATPEAWREAPESVWRFYQARRAQLAEVEPNAAHAALARLEREGAALGVEVTLVTQNVDSLHQRAGSAPLAMHGELELLRCERCGVAVRDRESLEPARFVACAACGHGRLRPGVVWFGEVPLHLPVIERALARCTHFLCIGTSGAVHPAAGFLAYARAAGAHTWVQALAPPDNLHPADRFVQGRAVEAVPGLVDELLSEARASGSVSS
ncbi:MAG: NAD-dependent deacylase [Planctomycetes bacterium]|nr:NAD-dependent deacylase [Planctomycetota bacterium]MDA0947405.1 NAD-dependent deacylase [Planctomycetota bacterium]